DEGRKQKKNPPSLGFEFEFEFEKRGRVQHSDESPRGILLHVTTSERREPHHGEGEGGWGLSSASSPTTETTTSSSAGEAWNSSRSKAQQNSSAEGRALASRLHDARTRVRTSATTPEP